MITPRAIRNVLVVLALTTPPIVLSHAPANADGCDGDVAGHTVGLGCGNGVQGATGAEVDPNWEVVDGTQAGPCIYVADNGDQIASYIADIRNLNTGEIKHNHCVAQAGDGKNGVVSAKKVVPNPIPDSDYKVKFLTGAKITFSSTNMANYTVTVPGFPNAKVVVTASDVKWDFGDGTTSTDLEPTHVYEKIPADEATKPQPKVHVTVTGTWNVVMLDNTTGVTTDLGSVTGNGAFDRLIEGSGAYLTAPTSSTTSTIAQTNGAQ